RFSGLHVAFAAFVDHATRIDYENIGAEHAQADQQVQAGDGGCTGARAHQLDRTDVLADHFEAIEDGGGGNDGGAVLVVMKDRDPHAFAQLLLDVETLRRLDVFEVHAAQRRFERRNDVDQFVGVGL